MSACHRTEELEALALGETQGVAAAELSTHVQHCALCRHELNWLQTEATLFRQRASRAHVQQLWNTHLNASSRRRRFRRASSRMLMALVAALFLLATVRWVATSRPAGGMSRESSDEILESSPLMSFMDSTSPEEACSRLPSGLGFHCGPAVPASFVAMR